MIHTLEIMRYINPDHIHLISSALHFTEDKINHLLDPTLEHSSITNFFYPNGIKAVIINKWEHSNYSLVFRINPQTLLTGHSSVDLFMAVPDNVQALQQRFHEAVSPYFHNLDIPNISELSQLSSYYCRRIDYTFDFRFSNQRDVDTFCNLTKKTSKFIRTTLRSCNNLKQKDQSTAEANKSVKVMLYDKKKQIEQTNRYRSKHVNDLINQAIGIVRIEVQCHKNKIESLRKKYGYSSKCIINYLNENIAADVLLKYYDNSVGRSDFYSLYRANKIIRQSDQTDRMKDKLYKFLQAIAHTRHVSNTRDNFKEGIHLNGNSNIVVSGSKSTFRSRLKLLQQLNINPVTIPKDWHIPYFRNPVYQLEMYISHIEHEINRSERGII